MTGGRSVEHDKALATFVDSFSESAEYRYFLGTWGTQVLLEQRPACRIQLGICTVQHFCRIARYFISRIDATHCKLGDVLADGFSDMCGGHIQIGRAHV